APSSWGNQPPHRSLSDRRKNPASSPLRIVPGENGRPIGAIGGVRSKRLTKAIGYKPAPFEPLGVERHADPVVPENLDQVTSFPPKNIQTAGVRIAPELLLTLQRQAVHAAPHVGVADRQPHPHAGGNRDHRRDSALTTAAANSGGTEPSMRTLT